MKTRLLGALVGLVISFVLPALAEQNDIAGPRIVQQRDLLGIPDAIAVFGELMGKLDDAYNKNDAEAAAALFTEDAVLVTSDGMAFGRQAIKEKYVDTFQRMPITDFLSRRDRLRLNAIDNAVWSAGQWSNTFQSQAGPASAWGFWSALYVPEGDAWKIRLLTFTEYRPLPPRTTPSSQ
jgi:uncharacterized protein (TIGR02246 family)